MFEHLGCYAIFRCVDQRKNTFDERANKKSNQSIQCCSHANQTLMISPLPERSVTIFEDLASRDNFLEIGADVSLPAGDGHMMMRASQLVHGDHASVHESKPQDNVLMPIENQEKPQLTINGPASCNSNAGHCVPNNRTDRILVKTINVITAPKNTGPTRIGFHPFVGHPSITYTLHVPKPHARW